MLLSAELSNLVAPMCTDLGFCLDLSSAQLQCMALFTRLTRLQVMTLGEGACRDLPDTLSQLKQLEELQILGYSELPASFSSLGQLRSLRLSLSPPAGNDAPLQDLQSYTQLTHLCIEGSHQGSVLVLLPLGKTVCLEQLWCKPMGVMLHLQHATRLSEISLSQDIDATLHWPLSMPDLRSLNTGCIPPMSNPTQPPSDSLPSAWQHYTNLEQLVALHYSLSALPDWVSALQKLTFVDLRDAGFNRFPAVLSTLRSIKHLHLGTIYEALTQNGWAFLHAISTLSSLEFWCISCIVEEDDHDYRLKADELLALAELSRNLCFRPRTVPLTYTMSEVEGDYTHVGFAHCLEHLAEAVAAHGPSPIVF